MGITIQWAPRDLAITNWSQRKCGRGTGDGQESDSCESEINSIVVGVRREGVTSFNQLVISQLPNPAPPHPHGFSSVLCQLNCYPNFYKLQID